MALPHISVATTDDIEILNLQPLDINPLMSKCEIKVFYIGENRNGSFISKDVATEMAKTLRGCPIVGYYKEEKEDFADHGHALTIDDEGFHFECRTVPYGFVAPDATVWFQTFNEQDDFGNELKREYLVTQGYLWTGQFEEAGLPLNDGGRPHSMELDENSLEGHWAENSKNGLEFFIISDAIFSKLCILGEDVEPCYEGSAVTTPSREFAFKDTNNDFVKTLSKMMTDLQFALNAKGESTGMNTENKPVEAALDENVQSEVAENQNTVEQDTSFTAEQETSPEGAQAATEVEPEFKKDEEEEKEEKSDEKDGSDEKDDNGDDEKEDDDKKKTESTLSNEFAQLKAELDELKTSFAALKSENESLSNFKANVESQAKKDMIDKEFYMLSDEDKADVVAHINEYSLDDIKSKLALICFEKKVTFEAPKAEQEAAPAEQPAVTFSLNTNSGVEVPDWVKAVQEQMN